MGFVVLFLPSRPKLHWNGFTPWATSVAALPRELDQNGGGLLFLKERPRPCEPFLYGSQPSSPWPGVPFSRCCCLCVCGMRKSSRIFPPPDLHRRREKEKEPLGRVCAIKTEQNFTKCYFGMKTLPPHCRCHRSRHLHHWLCHADTIHMLFPSSGMPSAPPWLFPSHPASPPALHTAT